MSVLVSLVLVVMFSSVVFAQDGKMSRAQRELVESERAFAKYCVENGLAEAWMEFFADDGVIFRGGPVNAKEFYRKRLPTPRPLSTTLNWEPRYGDVSQAGDFGYSMGPWTFASNKTPKPPDTHGFYFSVWKKQADGKWKVAMDFGSGEIADPNFDHSLGKPFVPTRQYKIKVPKSSDSAAELLKLKQTDTELGQGSGSRGVLETYLALIADDARTFKPGKAPADKDALRSYIPANDGSLTLAPIGGDIAKSSDMAYTYGSYELIEGGSTKEKGYYVHMWKRDPAGEWKIVVTNFTGSTK